MSKNTLLFLVIGIAVVGGIMWVMSNKSSGNSEPAMVDSGEKNTSPPATSEGMQAESSGVPSDTAGKTIKVDAKNFSFSPAALTVKKGEKVTIQLVNTEGFHDFVIDEFNVKTEKIGANQTAEVSFTPDKAGSFEYYCSVGSHRQMGMKGILTVED